MSTRSNPINAIGIDVGGEKKGFHAVALKDGRYRDHKAFTDIDKLVQWSVEEMEAQMIAVDAPCGWSKDKGARPAERELMKEKIGCFATPTEEVANDRKKNSELGKATNHYGWMLRGAELYRALKSKRPVTSRVPKTSDRCTFETFPHAITWKLRGGKASAGKECKRRQRKELLTEAGISFPKEVSMDFIDAALCALTAHMVCTGKQMKSFGEPETGLIIVPACA